MAAPHPPPLGMMSIFKEEPYKLSDKDLSDLLDNLDGTGGYLIKERELRQWIERIVNEDRERR